MGPQQNMKMLNSSDSHSKSGATSSKKSNPPPNQHADHVLLLDSLTASLKDELKRGLTLVDSIVNQLAQAKWVLLNVDKTLEELYENCPACDVNINKRSSSKSSSTSSKGSGKPHKVLPMVSGHTFQRPNITVTRVEQERRDPRSRNNAAPTTTPTPQVPSSSTAIAHSSSNPPRSRPAPSARRRPPPKRRPTRPTPKRKSPTKKPSSTPGASTSSAPSSTTAPVASPSSRRSTEGNPGRSQLNTVTTSKRPGPKSRTTVIRDADLPVLTREGTAPMSDDEDVVILPNSEDTTSPGTPSSSAKSPPTLIPYNTSDNKLKVSSLSLPLPPRPDSTQQSEPIAASAPTSSSAASSSSTGDTSSKRSSNDNSNKIVKKRKTEPESAATEKKDDKANLEDLLQQKFQKFRDQQRKRELERKAAAKKADSQDPDVIEIPGPTHSGQTDSTKHEEVEQGHSSGSVNIHNQGNDPEQTENCDLQEQTVQREQEDTKEEPTTPEEPDQEQQ